MDTGKGTLIYHYHAMRQDEDRSARHSSGTIVREKIITPATYGEVTSKIAEEMGTTQEGLIVCSLSLLHDLRKEEP